MDGPGQTAQLEVSMKFLLVFTLPFLAAASVQGQAPAAPAANSDSTNKATNARPARARPEFNRPITLAPDDKPAFPDPPAGFNARRDGVPHGKLELIEYDSKTVGTRRKMQVYTPPGYSKEQKCPVLYLLHG